MRKPPWLSLKQVPTVIGTGNDTSDAGGASTDITWNGWPPLGATKAELIDSVQRHQVYWYERERKAQKDYTENLVKWESTIAERLLALIPTLREGHGPEYSKYMPSGRWDSLVAPQPPSAWWELEHSSDPGRLAVLALLPDGSVTKEIRIALGTEPR